MGKNANLTIYYKKETLCKPFERKKNRRFEVKYRIREKMRWTCYRMSSRTMMRRPIVMMTMIWIWILRIFIWDMVTGKLLVPLKNLQVNYSKVRWSFFKAVFSTIHNLVVYFQLIFKLISAETTIKLCQLKIVQKHYFKNECILLKSERVPRCFWKLLVWKRNKIIKL